MKRLATYVSAREESAPEWGIGNDLDTELARGLEQADLLVFYVKRKGRIFDLNCGNRVHGMCAAKCRGGNFGKAEVLHLSLPG